MTAQRIPVSDGAVPFLDSLLRIEEAAPWLKMSISELRDKSGNGPLDIPVVKLGTRTWLYHPRSVLGKFAERSGAPRNLMSAYETETRL